MASQRLAEKVTLTDTRYTLWLSGDARASASGKSDPGVTATMLMGKAGVFSKRSVAGGRTPRGTSSSRGATCYRQHSFTRSCLAYFVSTSCLDSFQCLT